MSRKLSRRKVGYHLKVVIDILYLEIGEALHSDTCDGIQILGKVIVSLLIGKQSDLGIIGSIALHQLRRTASVMTVKHTVEIRQSLKFGNASVGQKIGGSKEVLICFTAIDQFRYRHLVRESGTGKHTCFKKEFNVIYSKFRHVTVKVLVFKRIGDDIGFCQSVSRRF